MSYIDVLKQTQNVMTPGSSLSGLRRRAYPTPRHADRRQQLPTAAYRAFPEPPSAEQRCFMSAMTTKAT